MFEYWQTSPGCENGCFRTYRTYFRAIVHPLEVVQKIWKNSGSVFLSNLTLEKKLGFVCKKKRKRKMWGNRCALTYNVVQSLRYYNTIMKNVYVPTHLDN